MAAPSHKLQLDVPAPTLALLDDVCEAAGLDAEGVRCGEVAPTVEAAAGADVLGLLCPEVEPEPGGPGAAVLGQVAGRAFFAESLRLLSRAGERAKEHAQSAGVWGLLQSKGGANGAPLSRSLARMEAERFELLYYRMPLGRAMTYLLLKTVGHASDNVNESS